MTTNYVDKQKLYEVLCEWHTRKSQALEIGQKAPKLPDYVGKCIIMIAEGLAKRGNFRNYTWIEEMVGDGIVNAVNAMNKFDPTRKNKKGEVNPFGFINLVVWRAFTSMIGDEKKKLKAKYDMMLDPEYNAYTGDDNSDHEIDNSGLNEFFYRGA